MTINKLYQPF